MQVAKASEPTSQVPPMPIDHSPKNPTSTSSPAKTSRLQVTLPTHRNLNALPAKKLNLLEMGAGRLLVMLYKNRIIMIGF